MNFLVKKIMEVSAKQGNMSKSPSTAADLDDIDGEIIDLDTQKQNGHVPGGKADKPPADKCCV